MPDSIKQVALRTIEQEAQSIGGLSAFINSDFEKAVTLIKNSKGRVVISGIGKSAIIAQKIVATLNSTGTPASFLLRSSRSRAGSRRAGESWRVIPYRRAASHSPARR